MDKYQFRQMEESDLDSAMSLWSVDFGDNQTYILSKLDIKHSVVVEHGGKVIGAYGIGLGKLPSKYSTFKDMKGCEGVAISIDEKYRNKGIGKELYRYTYDYLKALSYGYLFGLQLKELNNNHLYEKQGRITLYHDENLYVTVKFLRPNNTYRNNIRLFNQTKWYNCGPTALFMILNALNIKSYDIDSIEELSGTNDITGCTDENVRTFLSNLNDEKITYKRIVDKSKVESFRFINNALYNGYFVLLRTFTHGIKHWVVLSEFNDDIYLTYDPWLGVIEYTNEDIDQIWKERNYDCFIIGIFT